MKADFTRNTFDPFKNFTRVLMQQGRVQVDADWNEQVSILLHYMRSLTTDLIGEAGGPEKHCGFVLTPLPGVPGDFRIEPGHYYVDGLLCELVTSSIPISHPQGFTANEIQVPTLILDDIPFRKPKRGDPAQYVEISNNTGGIITHITDVDLAKHKITLYADVSSILDGQSPTLRRVVTYSTQYDYPVLEPMVFAQDKTYGIYLDVWERLITYVQDDSIREVALNGPDTAARSKLVWQVKIIEGTIENAYGNPCDSFVPTEDTFIKNRDLVNRGALRAMAKQDAQATDPCITPPHSQYRGVENQLYRVEIHRSGTAWDGTGKTPPSGAATFKWSRENGSVIYGVRNVENDVTAKTTTVSVESLGRDDRFGLVEGDWVELISDDIVLLNVSPNLLQVQDIDRASMTLILNGVVNDVVNGISIYTADKHPLLRRWDHKAGDPTEGGLQVADDGAVYIIENGEDQWLELEDGVKVQFRPRGPNDPFIYQTGDYWLIPARVATGDVEWPVVVDNVSGDKIPSALPPAGIQHHYAPLGLLNDIGDNLIRIIPCYKEFRSLAKPVPYEYAFGEYAIGALNLKEEAALVRGISKKKSTKKK